MPYINTWVPLESYSLIPVHALYKYVGATRIIQPYTGTCPINTWVPLESYSLIPVHALYKYVGATRIIQPYTGTCPI